MSDELPVGANTSNLMEWRVMLRPADDWDESSRPTPSDVAAIIDQCVSHFRDRLTNAAKRGEFIIGYGPVKEQR